MSKTGIFAKSDPIFKMIFGDPAILAHDQKLEFLQKATRFLK